MSQTITTLGKAWNRIDEMSSNCFDKTINSKEISFENLNNIKIRDESHKMRTTAQKLISNRL